jgi:hypothetical protein
MQFHEIQSQVAVADLRGGPDLEMIVGDLAGNVVCVNIDGDVLWDARSPSLPLPPPLSLTLGPQALRWDLPASDYWRCGWRWGPGCRGLRVGL